MKRNNWNPNPQRHRGINLKVEQFRKGTFLDPVRSFEELVEYLLPEYKKNIKYFRRSQDGRICTYSDSADLSNGYVLVYLDGNLSKVEKYVDGKRDGITLYRFANDYIVEADFNKNTDKKEGYYREFILNKYCIKDEFFKDDLKENWNFYYQKPKGETTKDNCMIVVKKGCFHNDILVGNYYEYYEDGVSLKKEALYASNSTKERVVIMVEYFRDGMVFHTGSYKNGIRNGPHMWYYDKLPSNYESIQELQQSILPPPNEDRKREASNDTTPNDGENKDKRQKMDDDKNTEEAQRVEEVQKTEEALVLEKAKQLENRKGPIHYEMYFKDGMFHGPCFLYDMDGNKSLINYVNGMIYLVNENRAIDPKSKEGYALYESIGFCGEQDMGYGGHTDNDCATIIRPERTIVNRGRDPVDDDVELEKLGEKIAYYKLDGSEGKLGIKIDEEKKCSQKKELLEKYRGYTMEQYEDGHCIWFNGTRVMMEAKRVKENGVYLTHYRGYYNNHNLHFTLTLNEDGELTGYVDQYYINGNCMFTGLFINGQRENEHYFYHENGETHVIATYHHDKLTRESLGFDEKGRQLFFVSYIDNVLEFKYAYYVDGKIREEFRLRNNEKTGLHFKYEDENSYWVEPLVNGVVNGFRTLYRDGSLKVIIQYRNGKPHGMRIDMLSDIPKRIIVDDKQIHNLDLNNENQ